MIRNICKHKKKFVLVLFILAVNGWLFNFSYEKERSDDKDVQQFNLLTKQRLSTSQPTKKPTDRKSPDCTQLPESIKRPVFMSTHNMESFFDLQKILKVGHIRKEKAFTVFGIPTVHRKKAYYVMDTVRSLVNNLSEEEKKQVVIVIMIADNNQDYIKRVVDDTKRIFPSDVSAGLIQVIVANPTFYPANLNTLPRLFGDNQDRVSWRSKQCLDYSFMYYHCSKLAQYYTQLEDDIIAEPKFFSKMKTFIDFKGQDDWSVLEFGARGFIGMTYRAKDLVPLSKFVRYLFWLMPVDWLFRRYNDIYLYGNRASDKLQPPIFKHVGVQSSLVGQKRGLEDFMNKEKDEVLPDRKYQSKDGNPDALLVSSITSYRIPHSIDLPYYKKGYFWAGRIHNGDTIDIIFKKPQNLRRIVMTSGLPKRQNDVFEKTELFYSSQDSAACGDYKALGKFTGSVVDYTFPDFKMYIKCIRLILKEVKKDLKGRPYWLIIDEIAALTY